MPKNVLVTRKIPDVGIGMLKNAGFNVDILPGDQPHTQAELIDALQKKQYDAVLSLLTDQVDAKLFDAAPSVKIYANYAIGFNNMDVAEAMKRGITLTNTPGNSFSFCIAEHAIALMLALSTRLVEGDRFVRAGKYKGWDPDIFVGTDLQKKKLGLIGAGHIGERVAHHASRGFDMEVLYYDVVKNEKIEQEYGAKYFGTPEEVLKEADFVSLHVPLLDSTKHLINADRLKLMKPSAFLVNTSRGPVVDENALVDALKNKVIRGAGLDVFEFEPQLAAGLAELENVVLTPHIASARESARNDMATLAAQNIVDFLEGREPKNKVNPPAKEPAAVA
ncbi:MAG TPA: D-glycerate dehydrogenase [Candidatus Paceibacterota bacterium]|jgi:lactate dehydrogenase-like 2-hydroxyacid dehydrogenase|nr:D-glycerate dehydrogenase [Candidatus Paceibacterota bacterium]